MASEFLAKLVFLNMVILLVKLGRHLLVPVHRYGFGDMACDVLRKYAVMFKAVCFAATYTPPLACFGFISDWTVGNYLSISGLFLYLCMCFLFSSCFFFCHWLSFRKNTVCFEFVFLKFCIRFLVTF